MDVILLKDVEKLGTAGAVVRVKSGFARNYLLPGGLAAPATPQQLKAVEAMRQQRQKQSDRALAEATALKQRLESKTLTFTLALGEGDKPFGSVTAHDVAEALAREGMTVEKHAIQLAEPLKALGNHAISVRVHADVTATVKLQVVKA